MRQKINLFTLLTGIALLLSLFLANVSIKLALFFNLPLLVVILLAVLCGLGLLLLISQLFVRLTGKKRPELGMLLKKQTNTLIVINLLLLPFAYLLAEKDDAPGLILFQLLPLLLILAIKYFEKNPKTH